MRIILSILTLFLITACADSPNGYFKKSANGKWIDAKGAEKRYPSHNRKQIREAKRNIMNDDVEDIDYDDEDEEIADYVMHNRKMYERMIQRDMKRKYKKNKSYGRRKASRRYPEFEESRNLQNREMEEKTIRSLKGEISEIKNLLAESKTEMASMKCLHSETSESSETTKPIKKQPPKIEPVARQEETKPAPKKATKIKESNVKQKPKAKVAKKTEKTKLNTPPQPTTTEDKPEEFSIPSFDEVAAAAEKEQQQGPADIVEQATPDLPSLPK